MNAVDNHRRFLSMTQTVPAIEEQNQLLDIYLDHDWNSEFYSVRLPSVMKYL
jgi:hypothetical protein